MTHRKSERRWSTPSSTLARQRRAQRAIDRAAARQRKAEQKRINRELRAQDKRRRRQEAQWKRAEQRRRRADDKRIRLERRRWEKQQKRQTLGSSTWDSGRGSRESATARRAAHNLISLASSIGVRFTKEDTDQLLAYADQELAGSGEDIYTIYQRLTQLTFIGRRVRGVVEQYDTVDMESSDADPEAVETRVINRVAAAGEILGDWERTKSVQNATVLGLAITQVLGATPDAIKADQRGLEAEVKQEAYDQLVQMYQGKSRLWTAVHLLLHPEDRLENVKASALEQLDEETRSADATQGRLAEALAGTGESASQSSGLVGWIRGVIGSVIGE